jgi:large subunit ribosomal protein L4
VRGGGTKPWRQKGNGRARAGSIPAPHCAGGGVTIGPTPRAYTVKVNRKSRRRALRAALSLHADRGSIAIVDAASFDEPSTSDAAAAIEGKVESPVLVLLAEDEDACAKSFRNIERVTVLPAAEAGVADILAAASIVASEPALEALSRTAAKDTVKAAG